MEAQKQKSLRTQLQFLDGLRGLAAVYVLLHHARWLLWEGYTDGYLAHPEAYSVWDKLIMYGLYIFRFGHEAVIFFFVLSGFVIHLRYSFQFKRAGTNLEGLSFDFWPFLKRRARRILPPLYFALLITFIADRSGIALSYPIHTQSSPYQGINDIFGPDLSLSTLWGNLTLVMGTYTPVWGTNAPLWSLKFEWWFYLIYPACWWMMKQSKLSLTTPTVAIGILYALSYYPEWWPVKIFRDIFSMMVIWWMGAILADVFTKRIRIPWAYLSLGILCFPLALYMNMQEVGDPIYRDVIWGIGFSGLLSGCFLALEKGWSLKFLESLKGLGDFSYSLYVIHMPLMIFLSGWLMCQSVDHRLPQHFGWVFLGSGIILGCSYLAYLIAEKPFIKARKKPSQQTGG